MMACKQMPQGNTGSEEEVTTTSLRISRTPLETILAIAVRSAQMAAE